MRSILLAVLGSLALPFSACSADDSEDTSGFFQELASAEAASASASCRCNRETFATVSECVAKRTPSAQERVCKKAQYAALPDGGAAVMACVSEAQRAWVDCIDQFGCQDLSACGTTRNAQIAECAPEEAAIRARCYFIDCPSGEEIPSTARCDGKSDCSDASDETNCFAGGS